MEKRLPFLLPSPSTVVVHTDKSNDKLAFARQKRRQVASACANCRRRKEKCDDKRPTCGACARRGVTCNNDMKQDESAGAVALRHRNASLKLENEQLRDLFKLLHSLPAEEGQEVISRLKAADDPIQVLRSVQEASLLINNPNSSSCSALLDSRLDRLDLLALRESAIRVDAKPWTAVAGDGIVSELISSFFNWDDALYLPFLDREAFVEDMRARNVAAAKFCTPFLVNAICAARCYTCRRTRAFSGISKKNLADDFFNEAKKLLHLEGGRASIPTVQGLTLLFSIACFRGTDKLGGLYRLSAYDMFHQLDVDAMYAKIAHDPLAARDRRVLSRLAWGLFLFESIVGYMYLQQSLLPPPQIPRCFEPPPSASDGPVPNIDLFGNQHTSESRSPPFVTGALFLACEITVMLYESMDWNFRSESIWGTEQDLDKRRDMIENVRQWRAMLPESLRDDTNFVPQTCYLRAYMNEVLFSILRPLPPQTEIEPGWTVKALQLSLCQIDIDNMERFVKVFTLRDYACINIAGAYNSILVLVYHLGDACVHQLFAKAAYLIGETGGDYPMCRYILQAIKAIAWQAKTSLPQMAKKYFENLDRAGHTFRDISFALPEETGKKTSAGAPSPDSRGRIWAHCCSSGVPCLSSRSSVRR
ncbi:Zn(2)-C6 fungal-type DNA-binding domain protein [Metarhizium album ARSEF 1941]|uniref:Zn(2)-C6 fungal-type DNA-binding domain protein n=1 Tax=Metarhizium album (strain ARSEF 1941) TaxID=1081103 RepID=A0A0B2WST9_METAS|nr:Zn(2)-C6 fungal-type DNA-binding domain protein [Metarhizium album ARSEF 1941]KHN99136.1 Zn(2)-C6 fungal-type DNA-binding domain protein [Metarhizium album ARSEF 1941]